MNFGLLDVLTVQNASSVDLPRKSSAAKTSGDNSFKDKVQSQPEPKDLGKGGYSYKKNSNDELQTLNQNAQSGNQQKINSDGDENILGNLVGQLSEEGTVANSKDKSQSQKFLTDVFNTLKGAKESGTENGGNILSSLLALQESASQGENIVDLGGVDISEVSEGDLEQFSQSSIVNLIGELVKNAKESLVDKKANVTNLVAASSTVSQDGAKQISQADINQIVGEIIDIVKENIETPEFDKFNIRSDQAESILKGLAQDKSEKNKLNAGGANKLDFANIKSDDFDADELLKTLDNLKDANKNLSDEIANQANKQLSANKEASISDGILKSEVNNNLQKFSELNLSSNVKTDGSATQKIEQQPDALNRFYSLTQAHEKAQDVVAQIKFGVSNAAHGSKTVSINLAPKELGTVDIRLETSADGKTKVAVIAEKTDTLNLLQKESGMLREMLQDALKTQESQLSFSFHDKGDDKWRHANENIQFGKNGLGSGEEEQEIINNKNAYNSYQLGLSASEGLNIVI